MNSYRVTYVEHALRERIIEAESQQAAEDLVSAEVEDGQHHHLADWWTDDWQVGKHERQLGVKCACAECGQPR